MVTEVPAAPEVGEMLLIVGATVNATPLLAKFATVTTTGPVVAPEGTGTAMLVFAQLVGEAVVPLNVTVLFPWEPPNVNPLIVIEVPGAPPFGDRLLMLGATLKLTPLLSTPLACTTTFPVVAPDGTVATTLVALQLVTLPIVPLNFTKPEPWLAPKLEPVIVTDAPTGPDVGERLVMCGVGSTVKETPLLDLLETVTTTLPVLAPDGTVATMLVALQLVAVARVPLNLTVLLPCVEPKFVPVIVTEAPTAPEVGDKLEMVGAAA